MLRYRLGPPRTSNAGHRTSCFEPWAPPLIVLSTLVLFTTGWLYLQGRDQGAVVSLHKGKRVVCAAAVYVLAHIWRLPALQRQRCERSVLRPQRLSVANCLPSPASRASCPACARSAT